MSNDAAEERPRLCPACKSTMQTVERKGSHIERCTRCYGMFFAADQLAECVAALKGVGESASQQQFFPLRSRRRKACPVCSESSVRWGTLGDLEAAHCSSCHGLFLPSPSLQALFKGVGVERPFRRNTRRTPRLVLPPFARGAGQYYDAGYFNRWNGGRPMKPKISNDGPPGP